MTIDYSLCSNLPLEFLLTSLSLKTMQPTSESMILMEDLCLNFQGKLEQTYKLQVCPLLIVNFCESSYGPSFELFLKPAVSAPGGNIISTFPIDLGNFAIASDTSLAASFFAGSAALVFSSKPKTKRSVRTKQIAKGILSLFESTAQKVPSSTNSSDPLQTLTQQGAGLINVSAAINSTTIISPTEILLNSTAHFVSV